MAREWFVRIDGNEVGPLSSAQLKSMAAAGKITRETELKMAGGNWATAGRVDGLFPASTAIIEVPRPPKPVTVINTTAEERKRCPLCGESIALEAVKCRHCNEFLDGRRAAPSSAPAPMQVVQQVVVHHAGPRFNPLVAALLSFIIPGLGQLYKGQPINGIVWFFVTLAGYVALIVPGLILHVLCVIGAASGARSR